MKAMRKTLKTIYWRVLHSIAFYPVMIGTSFFICSIALLSYENLKFAELLQKKAPFLYVQDLETARTILSTLVGSILSLMVFSFSMVMVVLNQASSNFSPRLLPGLISDKRHQIILGVYVGTLIHCVLVLIALGSYDASNNSIGFSTMIAAILGIICVGLFISFIHNIANAIRIDNIVQGIFKANDILLDKELEKKEYILEEDTTEWIKITSNKTGYYRGFNLSLLDAYFENQSNTIDIIPFEYQHIWKGDLILKIKNKIPEDKLESLLLSVEISENRYESDSFMSGLIKLMEVAVKAMSPGINDPGTATDVLHKLGCLLNKALKIPIRTQRKIESSNFQIIQTNICAKELMRLIIQPIRNYSKNDTSVVVELINTLQYLIKDEAINDSKKTEVRNELEALISDIKKNLHNKADQLKILDFVSLPL